MGPIRDVPRVPGLWDGNDNGIMALQHMGLVRDVKGVPGTLGQEGQWDYALHCGPGYPRVPGL